MKKSKHIVGGDPGCFICICSTVPDWLWQGPHDGALRDTAVIDVIQTRRLQIQLIPNSEKRIWLPTALKASDEAMGMKGGSSQFRLKP